MTVEQAWEIVRQACEAFVGNFQAHQQIQTALKVLADTLNPVLEEQNNEEA